MVLNTQFNFFTDAATLAVFDFDMLKHRAKGEDWWVDYDNEKNPLPEVTSGVISLIGLGGDGLYTLHVTSEPLSKDEKDFAVDMIEALGVESLSGQIFFGRAECLPGYREFDPGTISEDEGKFITVPPGKYTLQIYAIEKPAEIKSKGKLADIVIILTPRAETKTVLIHKNYCLDWNKRQFLFPSARTNKLKTPKMGIEVEVHVRLENDNNKTLWRDFTHGWLQKWPSVYDEYKIILEDMS